MSIKAIVSLLVCHSSTVLLIYLALAVMSKSNTPLGRLAAALAKTSATRHQQRKSKQTQSHLPCIEPTETLPDSTDDVETPREYMPDEILNYYSELIKKFDNFPAALRPVQIKSLITLLNKKSLICLAPTGYGKTLTYVLHGLILNQVQFLSENNL